jgi:4-diphosphocytidyl-2C-methyl-D-erythritol kinase
MDDPQQQVIDGEIEAAATPVTATAVQGGEVIVNMEHMIRTHVTEIDKLQIEIKKHKELLEDIFKNDPVYAQHDEKAKEATKIKQGTKAEILKRPQAADLDHKVKELKTQLKENQGALSDYLQEYQRMSGVNEIEGEDGEMREIVYTAKLIKKAFMARQ